MLELMVNLEPTHHMEPMVLLLHQIIKLHLDGELTNHYLQEIVTTLIYQMQETEDLMNGVERYKMHQDIIQVTIIKMLEVTS